MKPAKQIMDYMAEHGPKSQQDITNIHGLDASQSTISRVLADANAFTSTSLPGLKLYYIKGAKPPRTVEALIGYGLLQFARLTIAYAAHQRRDGHLETEAHFLTLLREQLLKLDKCLGDIDNDLR